MRSLKPNALIGGSLPLAIGFVVGVSITQQGEKVPPLVLCHKGKEFGDCISSKLLGVRFEVAAYVLEKHGLVREGSVLAQPSYFRWRANDLGNYVLVVLVTSDGNGRVSQLEVRP